MSRARDHDANAWAGRGDLVDPTCILSPIQARDPLDGGPVGPFLDRLALRRGRAAVERAVRAWLAGSGGRCPGEGWANASGSEPAPTGRGPLRTLLSVAESGEGVR